MSGHWICERCGYDGAHASWCVCLRPSSEQWKGHRTPREMEEFNDAAARVAVAVTSTEEKSRG